jgi:hypothetical protein
MANQGNFSWHRRDGDDVIKVLHGQYPTGARFTAAVQSIGVPGMNAYLAALRAAGVILPSRMSVESAQPLTIRHRWVTGPMLLDQAVSDPSRFVAAVSEIAQWIRALDTMDARMDANLANFCLVDDRVVLVDVLPPLIPSMHPGPSNLFEALFNALCFDTTVITDALIGFAARALLDAGVSVPAGQRDELARQMPQHRAAPAKASFPTSWFRAQAVLALARLAGEVEQGVVHDFFTLTSMQEFLNLSEAARADRVRQFEQTVQELDLL